MLYKRTKIVVFIYFKLIDNDWLLKKYDMIDEKEMLTYKDKIKKNANLHERKLNKKT